MNSFNLQISSLIWALKSQGIENINEPPPGIRALRSRRRLLLKRFNYTHSKLYLTSQQNAGNLSVRLRTFPAVRQQRDLLVRAGEQIGLMAAGPA